MPPSSASTNPSLRVEARLDAPEVAEIAPRGAGGDAALGAGQGRAEVVPGEGLLGGAAVVGHGARRLAPALEVLGELHGAAPAGALQVLPGEAVPEGAILRREHPVGRVPHQGVTEGVLAARALVGAAGAAADDLRVGERREMTARGLAEERGDAPLGEGPAEDAGGPQGAA